MLFHSVDEMEEFSFDRDLHHHRFLVFPQSLGERDYALIIA